MYKVFFSYNAEKQFNKLDNITQKRIINVLERIKIRPFNFVKRLAGLPYYSLRIGDYRAILDIRIKESVIFVVEVGHRSRIYK